MKLQGGLDQTKKNKFCCLNSGQKKSVNKAWKQRGTEEKQTSKNQPSVKKRKALKSCFLKGCWQKLFWTCFGSCVKKLFGKLVWRLFEQLLKRLCEKACWRLLGKAWFFGKAERKKQVSKNKTGSQPTKRIRRSCYRKAKPRSGKNGKKPKTVQFLKKLKWVF